MKADGTANSGKTVWFINERTNEIKTATTDSEGHAIFDCANFQEDYADGDVLTVAMEAYASSGYKLVKDAFEDGDSDVVEYNDQRLNMAEITINFKVTG